MLYDLNMLIMVDWAEMLEARSEKELPALLTKKSPRWPKRKRKILWLDTIEIMSNEILGNYSKKEDQLMTAAFGTRPKRRLNRVLDAI